ncbi:hypothetical protein OTERR_08380 [Oryzomicrobium terrae]|uniref:DUF2325 domain-containing protein n=1 Tax=Oryzomicrobium terrae TaxID=1735038 RepID=A0A5C1E6Q2_9RHOO|nr:DUF2325 domain-containing protein [Oryzomicrobium terrae]QEL64314.1 hypothetical protein OTERR_08380 [Oryzomicrobium terrae]
MPIRFPLAATPAKPGPVFALGRDASGLSESGIPVAADSAGSRRRRLWEVKHQYHCPVIGTCLPMDVLRRLAEKARVSVEGLSDFALHTQAVGHAENRTAFADLMQRELERRHALAVKRFAPARDEAALWQLWCDAVARGDVPGALWAVWTHPRCGADLAHRIYGEIHMISHQTGAGQNADLQRLASLAATVADLRGKLDSLTERAAERLAEKVGELEIVRGQLAGLESALAERDALRRRVAALEAAAATAGAREDGWRCQAQGQARRAEAAEGQVRALARALAETREELADIRAEAHAAATALDAWSSADTRPCGAACNAAAPDLSGRAVLCVGGIPALTEAYRLIVEKAGGRFVHHDGGLEDNPKALDGTLAAADAVICQAGCISHGAYWRLKDHCKRTGKPCAYLKRASVTSFVRGVVQVAEGAAETGAGADEKAYR